MTENAALALSAAAGFACWAAVRITQAVCGLRGRKHTAETAKANADLRAKAKAAAS
jgi:hypothetical protein